MEDKSKDDKVVCLRVSLGMKKFDVEGVRLSDTIGNIKSQIADNVIPFFFDKSRRLDPEVFSIKPYDGKMSTMSEDDEQTLDNYLSGLSIKVSEGQSLKIEFLATWYKYVDDEMGDAKVALGPYELDELMDVKRPQVLVENKQVLHIVGKLYVYHKHLNKKRRVPRIGGLRWPLREISKLSTPAKLVLLCFNFQHQMFLKHYHESVAEGIYSPDTYPLSTDANDELLIVQVTWDQFSYAFLRLLRRSLGSSVPFVAIMDSYVYNLDLLTFLDTPLQYVAKLYGDDHTWGSDLAKLCGDIGVTDVDVDVDIKWLGLRTSQVSDCKYECIRAEAANFPYPTSDDFANVCDFLLKHPRFKNKDEWVKELEKLKANPQLAISVGCVAPVWPTTLRKYYATLSSKPPPSPSLEYLPSHLHSKAWI